ncbi:NAD(P)H-binding protein, partial [Mycobacterium sp. E796]|uniref:NAD(P)H-binding protein n=1 Tax=Mycobacterium sp. E796 TaxID=1834151 RepID=UPI000ACF8DCC
MRILVTGATGYVGSRLVTALLEDGHQVVTATRNPERLKRLGWFDDVLPVTLDASNPTSVRQAMDAAGPIDVLYYLVHAIGQPGFRDADRAAAANVAVAAGDAGVRRIVYLGGFVPADEALSEHLASRAEVAEALTVEGGPELVWLGAAMIIGAGSTSFEMMRYVGDRFPLMPIPNWMDNPIDPADRHGGVPPAGDPRIRLEQLAVGGRGGPGDVVGARGHPIGVRRGDEIVQDVADGDRVDRVVHPVRNRHERESVAHVAHHL